MILLIDYKDSFNNPPIIAIFGVGLIGSSIASAIRLKLTLDRKYLPFSWEDPCQQQQQLELIEDAIITHMKRTPSSTFDLVWSAGSAGFGASEPQISIELANFNSVLAMAKRIADRCSNRSMGFHLISSAGGLFDGQRVVTASTIPTPQRPYGRLKLEQEKMLEEISDGYRRYIYRPSTVYGRIKPGQRRGLISAMITNGVQNKITYITGRMTTQRDFILVDDVAHFVLSKLMKTNKPEIQTYMLISGKPSTILEIQKYVEEVIKRKLYVNYLLNPTNEEDNSFSPGVMPKYWYPSPLRKNIPIIYTDALSSGNLFSKIK